MSNSKAILVPRVWDVTGKKPVEDLRAEKSYNAAKKLFAEDRQRDAYGTQHGKANWKRRIEKTRSL